MFRNNEYVGLTLQSGHICVAHVRKRGEGIELIRLDRAKLVQQKAAKQTAAAFEEDEEATNDDDIFGFEDTGSSQSSSSDDSEVDFEELEAQAAAKGNSDLMSLDMASEAAENSSNPIVLYDVITQINTKRVQLGLGITAGETIFQVSRETDFKNVKPKELREDVEEKLESIYDAPPSTDNYAYRVREDGSLMLASIAATPELLEIADETREIYSGKLSVKAIFPEEIALTYFVQTHYALAADEITAVIQLGPSSCRIVFLKGDEITFIMAPTSQGTQSRNVLGTIFSKMLFQLDSGKISGLNRIILANNTLGDEAITFFQNNFPEITVENFTYDAAYFDAGSVDEDAISAFTSTIALAAATAHGQEERLRALSFLPAYVSERQKIFKLQWHGLLLVVLIFLSIPTINYFYQQNAAKIGSTRSEIALTESRITQIKPVADQTLQISEDLTLITQKLSLLDSLSQGSQEWSTKFEVLNAGMNRIANSWLTSMSTTQGGLFLEGYTAFRNRVPAIVNLFAEATLLNVSSEDVRGEEMHRFSLIVHDFVEDSTRYSPEKPENIQQILNN